MLSTCIDLNIGRGVTLALALGLAACGAEQATSGSGTDTEGAGSGGPTTETPTTSFPTTDATATTDGTTSGATDAATGTTMGLVTDTTGDSGGTTSGLCPADTVVCDGDLAKVCDGMGGFTSETPCPGGCVDGQGCTLCAPNSQACDGEHAVVCNAEGSEQTVILCDGVQGVTCEDGQCVGACSPGQLGTSYIGCDYYPTVTANIVEDVYHFAVAVANTTELAANLEIDKNGALVLNDSVAPNSVKVITLPWDFALKADQLVEPASLKVEGGAFRLRSDQPVTVYQYNPLQY